MLAGEPPQLLVAGLCGLQLSGGLLQEREAPGENFRAVELEERVPARQRFVSVPVQLFQGVRDLGLDVRDAPLSLETLAPVAVALFGAAMSMMSPLQLRRDLREPRRLRFQPIQLLLGGGEVGEVLLCLRRTVGGPALLGFGLAQVAGEA